MSRTRIEVKNGNDELTFDDVMVTIGGRPGVDVLLRDVMVADRHCEIGHDGAFTVRDLGSVVGTWVDGERARPSAPLHDGSTIVIGTTTVSVAIAEEDGVAVLRLSTAPQSFWWRKPGKGVFGNDADRMVHSETRFGRFPALRLGNRVAAIGGIVLLLAATFVATVMDTLADPGPLMPAHAQVAAARIGDPGVHAGIEACVRLAGEQGCGVCHAIGGGAVERRCVQCHGLPGEMAHADSRRHPYHDGAIDDQQFCVLCHTDHTGTTARKPASDQLSGNCEACHDEPRQQLIARAPLDVPPQQPQPFEALAFPHAAHLAKQIPCEICHVVDPQVLAAHEQGRADDPMRHDYASVPYETCASCHVPDAAIVAPLAAATEEQRRAWQPPPAARWTVAWHGTDDEGRNCAQCHTSTSRDDGALAWGPEMRTVPRETFSTADYTAQRARFTRQSRSHEQQFAAHAQQQACTECHLDGAIETPAIAATEPRTFWHGLHMRQGMLAPGANAAAVSRDEQEGCASCHGALAGPDGQALADGAYRWPSDAESLSVCTTVCHRDGDQPLRLESVASAAAGERRQQNAFPHDVHLQSANYGKDGTLAAGCFACHEFDAVDETAFRMVPRTLPGAADCSACHSGHADIGGGQCQKCHPAIDGQSNSFLVQAGIDTPPWPTRDWPAPNGFRHLSEGHVGEKCSACHGDELQAAGTLAEVTVPDERAPGCRECHLEKQFHWR